MGVYETLSSISTNISNIYDKIGAIGGSLPSNKNIENINSALNTIIIDNIDNEYFEQKLSSQFTDTYSVSKINDYAFYSFPFTSVTFNSCLEIGSYAFANCASLTNISFPLCKSINYFAFNRCGLSDASFSQCTFIGSSAFYNCPNLRNASFPLCIDINSGVF